MNDSFNYVKGFDLFGVKARQIPCLTAKGEPTANLALKIGLLYINEDNGDMYKCVKGNGEEGLIWVKIVKEISDALNDLEKKIPIKPEDIGAQPVGNYLTSAPVTSVNSKTGKITLSASDVGAHPNTWIPTAEQVGADSKGTAASAISNHNTSNTAHNDLRLEIKAIREQLAAFLDVDEETLNELSELIARIVANQTSIEQLTTGKVNTADIIDNLVTSASNKPLSAAQGKELKTLIDDLTANKVDTTGLADAIYTELEVAHNEGMFKGDPGFSPWVAFEEREDGTYLVAHNETGVEKFLIDQKEVDDPETPGGPETPEDGNMNDICNHYDLVLDLHIGVEELHASMMFANDSGVDYYELVSTITQKIDMRNNVTCAVVVNSNSGSRGIVQSPVYIIDGQLTIIVSALIEPSIIKTYSIRVSNPDWLDVVELQLNN